MDKKDVETKVASLVLNICIKSSLLICFQVEIFNLEKD